MMYEDQNFHIDIFFLILYVFLKSNDIHSELFVVNFQ